RCWPRSLRSSMTRSAVARWARPRAPFTACIGARQTGCGPGSRRGCRRPPRSAAERAVDLLDVCLRERAHRLLELQAAEDEVVISLRQIEASLVDLLLLV